MRKLFTLLFAFAAGAGIILANGYYDEAVNIDGYYYLLNEGVSNYRPATATLVGDTSYLQSGSGTNLYCTTAVEIPASVNYNGKDYSVTNIDEVVFEGCHDLTTVTIPNSITSIGDYAFANCWSLASVNIPENVTRIGGSAFSGCGDLTTISIPNSVVEFGIGILAYSGVTHPVYNSHTFVFLPVSYETYVIPDGIETIAGAAFLMCSLKSVTIPNSVTYIGREAFEMCGQLSSVEIPNSVTSIESGAFLECTGLTSITCDAITPPTCGTEVFSGVEKSIHLYVPAESIDAYKATDVWKDFTNIQPIQAEEVPVTEIEAAPTDNSVVIEWPKVDEATVYTIEIRKNGVLICTLTFNEQGQLQSIAFAKPSRNGNRNAQVRTATQTATGWQYTINGLEANTEYTYNVVAKKNAGDTETLYNETITFTTKNTPTGIESLQNSDGSSQKILLDGQLYILREGQIFNVQGAKVK